MPSRKLFEERSISMYFYLDFFAFITLFLGNFNYNQKWNNRLNEWMDKMENYGIVIQ